ncbi:MAG: hypothetical protein RLZZ205_1342 [Bacteroidota bacterium]
MNLRNLIICTMCFLASCTKYQDGPGFSFRSKANRLQGHWFVSNAEAVFKPISGPGAEYTVSLTKDYADQYLRWQFIKDDGVINLNVYTGTTTNIDYTGQCNFSEDGKDLYIDFNDSWGRINRDTLSIKRLTNNELWLDEVSYQNGYNDTNYDTKYQVTVSTKWKSF